MAEELTAFETYQLEIERLYRAAGCPDLRTLGDRCRTSKTTAGDVVRGRRLCSWLIVERIVRELATRDTDAAVNKISALWSAAERERHARVDPVLVELRRIRELLEKMVEEPARGC